MKRIAVFFIFFFISSTNIFAQKKSLYFTFLRDNLFNRSEYTAEFIEGELQKFINTYPKEDTTGLALYLLYQINERNGHYRKASLYLLKALSVFNQKLNIEDCIDKIRKNLYKKEGVFRKNIFEELQRQAILDYLDGVKKHPIMENYAFNFIELLKEIKSKNIADIYIQELDWYRRLFPESKTDTILCWQGDYYFDFGEFNRSAEVYQMILKLYAHSPVAKRIYLRLADIYSKKRIWKFKEAAQLLKTYLVQFSDEESIPARIRLVQIDVEHLKNYNEGYEQFTKVLFENPHVYFERKIYYHLSNYFWNKGDLRKAMFVYEQFKKRYPHDNKIKKFNIYKTQNKNKK